MSEHLLRQRRRIAAALLFAQIAVFVVWPDPVAAATVALATVFASVAIIQAAASQRRWIECGGAGAIIAALMPAPLILPALLLAPVVFNLAFYGGLSDRIGLRFTLISLRKMISTHSATDTWAAIVPGEGDPEDHWSGRLIDYGRDNDDEATLYLRLRDDDAIYEEAIVTFLERDYLAHARFVQEAGADQDAPDRTVTLDFTSLSEGTTEIRSETVIEDLPLRQALSLWFDGSYGDELDGYAETIRARERWRVQRKASGAARAAVSEA